MSVVISRYSKKKYYHSENCSYARRILPHNRMLMSKKKAAKRGYCPCSCMQQDRTVITVFGAVELPDLNGIEYSFEKDRKTVYIKTNIGFWKMIKNKDSEWVLYHRNTFSPELPLNELKAGKFHRQNDVKKTCNVEDLPVYIKKHDVAKAIIREDYRKLPQSTGKERDYYRKAQKKAKRKESRRLNHLFAMLDAGVDNRVMLAY